MWNYIEPQYSEHFGYDITYFLTFPNRVRYIEVLLYLLNWLIFQDDGEFKVLVKKPYINSWKIAIIFYSAVRYCKFSVSLVLKNSWIISGSTWGNGKMLHETDTDTMVHAALSIIDKTSHKVHKLQPSRQCDAMVPMWWHLVLVHQLHSPQSLKANKCGNIDTDNASAVPLHWYSLTTFTPGPHGHSLPLLGRVMKFHLSDRE